MEEFFNSYSLNLNQLHQLTLFIGFEESKDEIKDYLNQLNIKPMKGMRFSYKQIRIFFEAVLGDKKEKAKTIVVSNRKGGIGKTTITVNVGHILHLMGYRVLIIDTDHQENTTKHYITVDDSFYVNNCTLFDYYQGACDLRETIVPIYEGYDLIPSHEDLDSVKSDYKYFSSKHESLKIELEELKKYYDFIIVDTAPGADKGLKAIYSLCDFILVPTNIDFDSRDGVVKLYNELEADYERGRIKKHPSDLMRVTFNNEPRKLTKSLMAMKEQISQELASIMFSTEDMSIKTTSRIHDARNQRVPVYAKTDGTFSDETLRRMFRLTVHVAHHLSEQEEIESSNNTNKETMEGEQHGY